LGCLPAFASAERGGDAEGVNPSLRERLKSASIFRMASSSGEMDEREDVRERAIRGDEVPEERRDSENNFKGTAREVLRVERRLTP